MLNGKFQASNSSEFEDAVDLYSLDQSPKLTYNRVKLNLNKEYRYVRYIGADSTHCNIAEMMIYTEKDSLRMKLFGKVIGTMGSFRDNEDRTILSVFDGNPLTFFDAPEPSGSWVGLDLGTPCRIDEIEFLPRNDDNNIRIGDTYELMYWAENGKWISLGKK